MVNVLYTAHGSATGGRDGHGATDDKKVDVKLSVPKEMGGEGGVGTNPEQLFATGYSRSGSLLVRRRSRSRTTPKFQHRLVSARAMTAKVSALRSPCR